MCSHAGELYSSTESNKILVHAAACVNRERTQSEETVKTCIVLLLFMRCPEETDLYRQKVKLGEGEM